MVHTSLQETPFPFSICNVYRSRNAICTCIIVVECRSCYGYRLCYYCSRVKKLSLLSNAKVVQHVHVPLVSTCTLFFTLKSTHVHMYMYMYILTQQEPMLTSVVVDTGVQAC